MTEWARWPWQRCKAVQIAGGGHIRCSMRKRHSGDHITKVGNIKLAWSAEYWVPPPSFEELAQDE